MSDEIDSITESDDEEMQVEQEALEQETQLPLGGFLSLADVDSVLGSGPSKVIFIAGDIESGKTSLLAGIYSGFNEGPFGSWKFAGSKTLAGLELRSFGLNHASGRRVPTMSRTSMSPEFQFQHLSVFHAAIGRLHLLLTDTSGELYEPVLRGDLDPYIFNPIKRADHFCVLLNSTKLCGDEKHVEVQNCRLLLRSLIEGHFIGKQTAVQLVVSKADLVTGDSNERFVVKTTDQLHSEFLSSFRSLSVRRVAALPEPDTLAPGFGLQQLLEDWAGHPDDGTAASCEAMEANS